MPIDTRTLCRALAMHALLVERAVARNSCRMAEFSRNHRKSIEVEADALAESIQAYVEAGPAVDPRPDFDPKTGERLMWAAGRADPIRVGKSDA